MKKLDKSRTWKRGLGKKNVSMNWKPERTVHAKVRDIKNDETKNDYPDRLKPTRAIYAKVKDYDKVTASGGTWLTWGISTVKRPPTYGKVTAPNQIWFIWGIYKSKSWNCGIQSC